MAESDGKKPRSRCGREAAVGGGLGSVGSRAAEPRESTALAAAERPESLNKHFAPSDLGAFQFWWSLRLNFTPAVFSWLPFNATAVFVLFFFIFIFLRGVALKNKE